ncbi:hypothetical protein PPTG_23158 [Phytophthora nicotianae INRA-310]|uniref:Uncharacterized protein n=1 Tax=Phytophthora nicotianae (strain INRA-310) TaxID=761204 RepID=W2Q3G5_PHYN3|nr:hypothetical protein PPTG_23158 [Phytophthora nicotianae INRA-310]ETN07707.1 hypothetical protein PPTG_23158 [Phytophthora nicotianae INRA-310]
MAAECFPGCVGLIDETALPPSHCPAVDGSSYWDKKKTTRICLNEWNFIVRDFATLIEESIS